MIKRLLAVDGVTAVALFRDDGVYLEGYGLMDEDSLRSLCNFAHDYKRLVQSNADQLSMFTQVSAWTPPQGWIVRAQEYTVCSIGNLVCLSQNSDMDLNEVMSELWELAHY